MIKQAIIPLAGLGTRLLPLTSVFAKELLPMNGKPGVEYILDECIDAGISSKKTEILDKTINVIKTNRGGKITWHGPGQKIFYFVINLTKRGKDIRKFINNIESVIIETLKEYKIESFADRENVGIWVKKKNKILKIAAIGVKVRKWIAYHGFSVNINNDLNKYNKIIPCGIKKRGLTNLSKIKKQNYKTFEKRLIKNFLKYFKS